MSLIAVFDGDKVIYNAATDGPIDPANPSPRGPMVSVPLGLLADWLWAIEDGGEDDGSNARAQAWIDEARRILDGADPR